MPSSLAPIVCTCPGGEEAVFGELDVVSKENAKRVCLGLCGAENSSIFIGIAGERNPNGDEHENKLGSANESAGAVLQPRRPQ